MTRDEQLRELIVKHTIVGSYPDTTGLAKGAYALGRADRNSVERELYEALEACRALALHCAELDHPIIAKAHDALAKARGEQVSA